MTPALRRELLSVLSVYAAYGTDPNAPCHKGLTAQDRCSRCGPILRARALVKELERQSRPLAFSPEEAWYQP